MGFIAIDKHSRKILGYLCKNEEMFLYCCGECEVEFTRAKDLEEHMKIHGNIINNISKTMKTIHHADDINENEVPPTVLSDLEKEKQLQIKYQVTPCTVQLERTCLNKLDSNVPEYVAKMTERKRPPAVLTQPSSIVKKPRIHDQNTKKLLKKKLPAFAAVCFLCGMKFNSSFSLDQHQKTHLENNISTPVFPCKVCGKSVKNMKMHLRQHETENNLHNATTKSKAIINTTANCMEMVESNETKVEEASSSTDAVFTKLLTAKEPENGVTSNGNEKTIPFGIIPNEAETISQDMHYSTLAELSQSLSEEITSPLLPLNVQSPNIIDDSSPSYELLSNNILVCENDLSQSVNGEQTLQKNGEQGAIENENEIDRKIELEEIQAEFSDETFTCNICTRRLINRARLIKHLALHENKVPCEICGKMVGGSYKKIHTKKYHNPEIIIPSETQ